MTTKTTDTEESLSAEYNKYCKEHNLNPLSADELLHELLGEEDREKHAEHIKYLKKFIERWEAWADQDYAEWSANKNDPIKVLERLVRVTETMVAELNLQHEPSELDDARALLEKHKEQ